MILSSRVAETVNQIKGCGQWRTGDTMYSRQEGDRSRTPCYFEDALVYTSRQEWRINGDNIKVHKS